MDESTITICAKKICPELTSSLFKLLCTGCITSQITAVLSK